MLYFAGRGVQVNGANYLIPIGAVINGEAEMKIEKRCRRVVSSR